MTALARSTRMHPADGRVPALLLPFPGPGHGPAQRIPIPPGELLLGRGEVVFQAPFADPAMALRHAEVRLQSSGAVVQDLGSGSGTHLNGAVLIAAHVLEEGDVLRLGDTVLVYTCME